MRDVYHSLKYQTGEITIQGGLAKLKLSKDYRFLNGDDAEKVWADLWENLPSKVKPLGMILPADVSPVSSDGWGVFIYWKDEGYIKDDDAQKIDYDELLKNLKENTQANNAERAAKGLPSLEMIGWAQPPRYDQAAHKLYWATEVSARGGSEHFLNYRIRILGRRGVMELNAIAGMNQLDLVTKATPELLSMIDFNQGHRYVDFDPSTDKVAEYGLAALIAGGVAAKVGIFKGVWIALLAAKKFIIIGLVALAVFLKKMWGRMFGGKSQYDASHTPNGKP
jgi:uncharacterized membrane-anchored protein